MDNQIAKKRTKNILKNICISVIILFIGIILIVKSITIEEGLQNLLYTYNLNKSVNYTVDLKENSFFETQTLDMNNTYISSLVDNINMDFSYSFNGNEKSKIKYIYQIIATTNVKYADDNIESKKENIIWSKNHIILESKTIEVEGSNFVINEKINIDFDSYNNEVKEFKQQFKIPIVAELQVKLIVRVNPEVSNVSRNITEMSIMNMQMDLDEDVFTINKQFENLESKSIIDEKETKKNINKPMIIIGGVCVLFAVLVILASLRKSIKFSKKTDYAIALNRILKNYGDIVAEIVSPIEIDNLNVIEVKNFDQLLDIEEEIRMPILFYETIPDEQGEFVIICDNMAYRYVIG